jgi:hypothetical protein
MSMAKYGGYRLVTSERSPEDLEKQVGALLAEGWIPLGAAMVIPLKRSVHGEIAEYTLYAQTMVQATA